MAAVRFRQLPHTADIRLAVWGDDEDELVRNAVAGVTRAALGDGGGGGPARSWAGLGPWDGDLSWRLVRAANEAVFQLFARRMRVVGFRRTAAGAELGLTPLAPGRLPRIEIKAVTFHDLHPRRTSGRLRAVLTLDV